MNHDLYFHKPIVRTIAYITLSVFLFWLKGFQVCVCVCVRERDIKDISVILKRRNNKNKHCVLVVLTEITNPNICDKQIITGTLMLATASLYSFAAINGSQLDIDPGLPIPSVPGVDNSTAFGTFA